MNADGTRRTCAVAWSLALAGLMAAAIVAIFVVAPTEQTMGNAQRILYVHVATAWCALLGFVGAAATGAAYLLRRNLAWDHWSQAAAESGWVCGVLTLLTGSLWARTAWGTWWTWEPRLTATFVLWAIYSGYLLVRAGLEDPHRRARLGAVVAILGAVDLPMVLMATRWFRGMHPASPALDPRMRAVLLVSVVSFTALAATLVARRRVQLRLRELLASRNPTSDPWA
jgi:heme exporter protein C